MTNAPEPTSPDPEAEPEPDLEGDNREPGRGERLKAAIAAARDRVETTRDSIEARRPDDERIDFVYSTMERDTERGGGLMAGALAYRFFFWMLPFLLVLIGALGFMHSADERGTQDLASHFGAFGFAAKSVSQAAADSDRVRFWALAVGLPALYLTSVSFVKALMVVHSLVWGVPNKKIRKKPLAALAMTLVLIGAIVALAAENSIRSQSPGPGLIAVAGFLFVAGLLWLFVSWNMPRPEGTGVMDLVPGILVFGIGVQIVHFITVYYVSRKVAHASESYGALGAAAGILLSLFFIARVGVLGAEVNAEMWARKQRRQTGRDDPMSSSSVEPQ